MGNQCCAVPQKDAGLPKKNKKGQDLNKPLPVSRINPNGTIRPDDPQS